MMRKMHVPAYWPGVLGCQAREKSGVLVEVKKVIVIEDMGMDVDIEVAIGMDMPVLVVAIGIFMFLCCSLSVSLSLSQDEVGAASVRD